MTGRDANMVNEHDFVATLQQGLIERDLDGHVKRALKGLMAHFQGTRGGEWNSSKLKKMWTHIGGDTA